VAVDCGLLTDLSQIERLFARLAKIEDGFGFDIEGGYDGPARPKHSLHPETATLAGVSFSGNPSWARYIPVRYRGGRMSERDELEFIRLLAVLLGSGKGIAHHGKFELCHLAREFRKFLSAAELAEAGLEDDGYFPLFSDSMIESYLLGESRSHALKFLTNEYFGWQQAEITDLFPPMTSAQEKCLRFTDLELSPAVVSYACDDAAGALILSHRNRPRVCDKLLYKVEMAIIPILARMEDHGVLFDFSSMSRVASEAEQFAGAMRTEIMRDLSVTLGKPVDINLASSPQVADVLYGQLGYRTTRMTKGSEKNAPKMSTDEKALAGLAKKHPVVKRILQHREIKKLVGSYLVKFPRDFAYAKDGRTHPSHNQVRIVSGRLSVNDPPYQQLPKKYEFLLNSGHSFNLKFRDFVMAAPGHYLIGFDYSQIEPAMLKAFNDGLDIHALTASLLFSVPLAEVTDTQRGVGKTQNFAVGYGQTPKGIAERLGIPLEEAKILFDKYFSMFASLRSWISKQTMEGVRLGYTVSKFGRKHPIWELESPSSATRSTGERLCVNAPVQGCLPSDTRVLTRGGWVPMGEFVDGSEVWTGAEWASAVRLPKGVAPRVRLHLSDGRTFDCDDRHKLLVSEGAWPEWCLVTDIKGKKLVRDRGEDWGVADRPVEDWYWVGRMTGDGSFSHDVNAKTGFHRTSWTCSFNAKTEIDIAQSFLSWLRRPQADGRCRFVGGTNSKLGFHVEKRGVRSGGVIKIQGGTQVAYEFWASMGLVPSVGARGKRIPDVVFTLDRERRQAFFDGYYGADGSTRDAKIISASRGLLEDSLRLAQTLGIDGKIRGPFRHSQTGATWHELTFYEKDTHHLIVEDVEYLDPESMYTLSVKHERHAFSSEGLISKNSAADLMKIAMVRSSRALDKAGLRKQVHLIMNIHDALVWEVELAVSPQRVIDLVQPEVCLEVPGWPKIEADWEVGLRWGSMKSLTLDKNHQIILPSKQAKPEMAMAG
jgi:DNA polymerase I-like protein with 3'-5' exonuclease and polymerase domains